MEQLKHMKDMLTSTVQGQLTHLESVDAKELGEAIDMIKDLAEAIYYCTVTEAMEGKEKEGWNENGHQRETMYYPVMYYQEVPGNMDGHDNPRDGKDGRHNYDEMYPYYNRDVDWMRGRMYYDGNRSRSTSGSSGGSSSNSSGTRNYSEREMPWDVDMRDSREGRSPMSRKNYMESKEMHKDKASQMHELEKYVQELTSDMIEMVEGASPEEKQLLSNKIAALATKIK